jgi:hypothetical protein
MSIFGLFRTKSSASVTAHILDPNSGYTRHTWIVGSQIQQEAVDRLAENGNVFVVVHYERGEPKSMVCKREIWDEVRKQFELIEGQSRLFD